jgi:hypothetical protein
MFSMMVSSERFIHDDPQINLFENLELNEVGYCEFEREETAGMIYGLSENLIAALIDTQKSFDVVNYFVFETHEIKVFFSQAIVISFKMNFYRNQTEFSS